MVSLDAPRRSGDRSDRSDRSGGTDRTGGDASSAGTGRSWGTDAVAVAAATGDRVWRGTATTPPVAPAGPRGGGPGSDPESR